MKTLKRAVYPLYFFLKKLQFCPQSAKKKKHGQQSLKYITPFHQSENVKRKKIATCDHRYGTHEKHEVDRTERGILARGRINQTYSEWQ